MAGGEHPQSDLADDAIASEVARANDQLLLDAASRGVFVVSGSGGPEESCRSLQNLLARGDGPAVGPPILKICSSVVERALGCDGEKSLERASWVEFASMRR